MMLLWWYESDDIHEFSVKLKLQEYVLAFFEEIIFKECQNKVPQKYCVWCLQNESIKLIKTPNCKSGTIWFYDCVLRIILNKIRWINCILIRDMKCVSSVGLPSRKLWWAREKVRQTNMLPVVMGDSYLSFRSNLRLYGGRKNAS